MCSICQDRGWIPVKGWKITNAQDRKSCSCAKGMERQDRINAIEEEACKNLKQHMFVLMQMSFLSAN